MNARLQLDWNVAGSAATGGSPSRLCTDGEQIYYIAGSITQSVVAASPIDGSEIWESAAVGTAATALCTDGLYVYAHASVVDPGLRRLNRSTGASAGVGGVEYACSHLRANGVYCVGIAPNSNSGSIVFYAVATPTETGVATPATQLYGVAIDETQAYVGGVRNTQDVWAYTLSSRALAWSTVLPTAVAPQVESIVADGDLVYVATNSVALTAGGTASLFCLGRADGVLLWTLDTTDLVKVAVDDQYLFVIDTSDNLIMFQLLRAAVSPVAIIADWDEVVCDGVSVIGHDATTTANFMRHHLGGPSKTFMRATGDDPSRRPFYTLAVPV